MLPTSEVILPRVNGKQPEKSLSMNESGFLTPLLLFASSHNQDEHEQRSTFDLLLSQLCVDVPRKFSELFPFSVSTRAYTGGNTSTN